MKLLYSSFVLSTVLSTVASAATIVDDKTKSGDDVATYNSPHVDKKADAAAVENNDAKAKNLRGLNDGSNGNPWEGGSPLTTVLAVLNDDKTRNGNGVAQKCDALSSKAAGSSVKSVISTVMEACVLQLPKAAIVSLQNDPDVKSVDEDQPVYATAPSWGLDRINQCEMPLDGKFEPKANAAGTRVYVLDTGLNWSHEDFNGMIGPADCHFDAENDLSPAGTDGHGHGTHVASTVLGHTYGVVTGAELCVVKVLDRNGSGSATGVMSGIDFVAGNCNDPVTNPQGKRCVINMSLGGGYYAPQNDAVNAAVDAEVVTVVAAGNDSGDACGYSPASAEKAITVGSTTSSDALSGFSNFGSCMDIWAPGSSIKAAWIGSNGATNTISGTSMASPHVAAVAAAILAADNTLSANDVVQKVQADAFDMDKNDPGGFTVELATTVGGCKAPTVSPAPTVAPTTLASCLADPSNVQVDVEILTDDFPAETKWDLVEDVSSVVRSGSGYTEQRTMHTKTMCVPGDTAYTFTIHDAYGDGIYSNRFGKGSYKVTSAGVVYAEGGNFNSQESTTFILPIPAPTPAPSPAPIGSENSPAPTGATGGCGLNRDACSSNTDCCSGNCSRGSCKGNGR